MEDMEKFKKTRKYSLEILDEKVWERLGLFCKKNKLNLDQGIFYFVDKGLDGDKTSKYN